MHLCIWYTHTGVNGLVSKKSSHLVEIRGWTPTAGSSVVLTETEIIIILVCIGKRERVYVCL
jgi:hypothetical protein